MSKYEFQVTVKFRFNAVTTNKTHIFIYFLDFSLSRAGQAHTYRVSMLCVKTTATATIWMSCVNLLLPRELLSQNAIVSNRVCVCYFFLISYSHASSLSSVRATFASKTFFSRKFNQAACLCVYVIHSTCVINPVRNWREKRKWKKCLEFGVVSFLSPYNSNDNENKKKNIIGKNKNNNNDQERTDKKNWSKWLETTNSVTDRIGQMPCGYKYWIMVKQNMYVLSLRVITPKWRRQIA